MKTALCSSSSTISFSLSLARDSDGEGDGDRMQTSQRARRSVWMTFCILLLLELAFAMLEAPRLRIFEQIITCRAHNQHDLVHFEELLNSADDNAKVQSELALIIGWGDTLAAAAGILVSITYGLLADRHGRRLVLRLNIAGLLLSSVFVLMVMQWWTVLPLRTVWLQAVFNFIGGGPTVTAALFFMIIADVSSEVQRIRYFSLLAIAGLAGQVVGAPLASALMIRFNAWIPVYVATLIIFIATALSLLMPETANFDSRVTDVSVGPGFNSDERTPLIAQFPGMVHDEDEDEDEDDENTESYPTRKHPQYSSMRDIIHAKTTEAFGVLFCDWRVFLLLATFPLHVVSRCTMKLLLQYVTQRYSWTMASAGFLNSLRASVNIVLLALIIPLVTKLYLERWKTSSIRKDLSLAKLSMLLLTVGSFAVALSPNVQCLSLSLVVYTLGTGFALFVRSVATSLVEPGQVGRLYSAMSMFDAFGQMTAGPMLAEVFRVGLERGKFFSGLPFLVGGILHGMALLAICLIRLRKDRCDDELGVYVLVEEPRPVVV